MSTEKSRAFFYPINSCLSNFTELSIFLLTDLYLWYTINSEHKMSFLSYPIGNWNFQKTKGILLHHLLTLPYWGLIRKGLFDLMRWSISRLPYPIGNWNTSNLLHPFFCPFLTLPYWELKLYWRKIVCLDKI